MNLPMGEGVIRRRRHGRAITALALGAALLLGATPTALASNPFPFLGSFEGPTLDSGWVMPGSETIGGTGGSTLNNSAQLTGTNSTPGWLQLTSAGTNQAGWVYNTTPFPSSAGVLVNFDYADFGGTGADGLTFFLFGSNASDPDGSTPLSLTTGPTGGSLGYADCPQNHENGLTNAYVGIGLDEWGNFGLQNFCNVPTGVGTNGPGPSGRYPNYLIVRGPGNAQSGYTYEAGAPVVDPANSNEKLLGSSISDDRHVTILITPSGQLSVYITFPDGNTQTVASNVQLPANPPDWLQLGFVASTGGSTNFHDIRADSVTEPVDIQTRVGSATAGAARGATITDTFTVTNAGPNESQATTIGATTPSTTLSNVAWTCTGACNLTSGTGLPSDTIDLQNGDTATYTITGVDNSTSDAQAQIQLTATPTGATGQDVPGDNVAQAATLLPPVALTAPTFTLAANGNNYNGTATEIQGTYSGLGVSVSEQWQRCDSTGTNCADIGGQTATAYNTQAADLGSTLRVVERASNAAGTVTQTTPVFSPLPITTLSTGTASHTNQTAAAFTLGASNYTAGQVSFQCNLDGAGWSNCSATPSYSALGDGSHTLQARAVHDGLSDPAPQAFTWIVDTVAPAAPVLSAPVDGSFTNHNEPTVSGTAEPGSTVTIYVDGVAVGTTVADGSGNYSLTLSSPLSDGPHSVKATATDASNNVSGYSAADPFTVDTVPPAAPVIKTPSAGATTSDDTPTITGTAEAGSTVTVYVDGKAVGTTTADGSGNWSLTPSVPLSDGTHTITSTATDKAGNTSALPTGGNGSGSGGHVISVTVDTGTPPPVTVVSQPPQLSNTSGFVFSPAPGSTLQCSIDGGAWQQCPDDYDPPLSDGSHTLNVRQVNGAGTSSSTETINWILDTQPPAPPVVTGGPNGTTNVSGGTFIWISPPGDITQCQLGNGRWRTCISGITFVSLPIGSYTLSLRSIDPFGNVSQPTVVHFTVKATAKKPAPVPAALACTKAQLVLVNVYQRGRRVYISGAARAALIRKRVGIRFMAFRRLVGHAKVNAKGLFALTLPLPAHRLAISNAARYEAVSGRNVSPALKLQRRLQMTSARRTGALIHLAGHVSGSFRPGTKVSIRLRITCSTYRTVAVVRLTRSGTYSATVRAPTGAAGQVATYRAQTTVLKHRRPFQTYSLPTTPTG
jgi:hypothetical protein